MSNTREFAAGQMVGPYKLVAFLGAGGMSQTWLAKHPEVDKKVVIKVLLPELAAIPQARGYFSAEGKLGAKLHHSNIVNLIIRGDLPDYGTGYIVLEYVEGIDLERLLAAHRAVSPEWAVYVGRELLLGLSYVHRAVIDGQPGDVVHRDVTPDNVFLSCDAEAKLGDFGIAQVRAALRDRTAIPGQIKGKYKYLSPEMARHELVDRRADLFQVGLILYEMVTGTAAFSATRAGTENIKAGVYRRIAELRNDVPPALVQVIERLMANNPDDRFSTADEVIEALEDAAKTFNYRGQRARREIAEAVTKLANLSASTVFPIPDQLRQLYAAALARAPQPSASKVVVQAPPEARTLIEDPPSPAAPRTPLLPENVPQPIPTEKTPIERNKAVPAVAVAAPQAALDMRPTEPLQFPPPRPRQPRQRTWMIAGAAGVMLLGAVGAVAFLARRGNARHVKQELAPEPLPVGPTPPPAAPPTVTPPVAPAPPAAPPPVKPAPLGQALQGGKEVKRERVKEPNDDAVPAKKLGLIVVRKESQPMRVTIDGASFVPPVRFPAEPGPHTVEIVRGDPANELTTRTTVNVSAGHHYTVNKSPPAAAVSVPSGEPSSPARTYEQAYNDAYEKYAQGMCALSLDAAREAVRLASNSKQRSSAYRVMAGASCCLHEAATVAEIWPHLDDTARSFASYVCSRYQTETPKR